MKKEVDCLYLADFKEAMQCPLITSRGTCRGLSDMQNKHSWCYQQVADHRATVSPEPEPTPLPTYDEFLGRLFTEDLNHVELVGLIIALLTDAADLEKEKEFYQNEYEEFCEECKE